MKKVDDIVVVFSAPNWAEAKWGWTQKANLVETAILGPPQTSPSQNHVLGSRTIWAHSHAQKLKQKTNKPQSHHFFPMEQCLELEL